MIIVRRADRLQDGIVFNRKIRFKHPEVIIKTWYGLKIYTANKTFRLYFKCKVIYNEVLFMLDLDNKKEISNA